MNGETSALRLRLALADLPPSRLPDGFRLADFARTDAAEVERLLIDARADGLAGAASRQIGWFGRVSADSEWDARLVVLARCEADGSLAAVAHNRKNGSLKDVAVAERFRRRGLARALIAVSAHLAEQGGRDALELQVLASNVPARRLYASAGFRLVER